MRPLQNIFLILCVARTLLAAEPTIRMLVHTDQPGASISPTMWGIFFEDINFGADGGLEAELVKNRSFEFPDSLAGWSKLSENNGSIEVLEKDSVNGASPHYLHLASMAAGKSVGVANEGFRGMGVRAGASYEVSAAVRSTGSSVPALNLRLVSPEGHVLAEGTLKHFETHWTEEKLILRAAATEPKAHLELLLSGAGALDLDNLSLCPEATWKHRPHGLRADLVQRLADLKPGFMRFPGGCIVEGKVLDTRYQWKKTIGPRDERPVMVNRWNDEFKHRPTPDYFQSFGLGFFEFFQLCEDIGAEPLPILNCGMACQFNSGQLAPLDRLDPYIQDALDLVEFANGPASSPWGQRRAQMGHPRPFHLKYLGIGNEQWGEGYFERYIRFKEALQKAAPDIQLVSSAGPSPDDERFQFAWPKLRALGADIVDEHCYARSDWFLNNTTRYDHYDRGGPKVFMGEYAAQSVKTVSPDNRNTWECALAEGAYMIGLEHNADVVVMASYAPLFAHVDAWQWTPDLIWFDNLRSFGTPNYYVQQLFSRNKGDVVLPVELGASATESGQTRRFYASAAWDRKSREVILKVANATASTVQATLELAGVQHVKSAAHGVILTAANLDAVNTLEHPLNVAPHAFSLDAVAPTFSHTFPASSLTVIRISLR